MVGVHWISLLSPIGRWSFLLGSWVWEASLMVMIAHLMEGVLRCRILKQ